jgi:hypothetical protein
LGPDPEALLNIALLRDDFGAIHFSVQLESNDLNVVGCLDDGDASSALLLAINSNAIFLVGAASRRILRVVNYSQLSGWACSSTKFFLRVLDARGAVEQTVFLTPHGARIKFLVQSMVEFLVAFVNKVKLSAQSGSAI